jgi:hypothetical protein
MMDRDDELRHLPILKVGTEHMILARAMAAPGDRQDQGCTCVEVPDLDRVDTMPSAGFAFGQQKEYAGTRRSTLIFGDPGLAVVTAFRVRRQI